MLTFIASPMILVEGFVMFVEFSPAFEPVVAYQYQSVAITGALVILNAMACRVFRLLRLESHGNVGSQSLSTSTMRFGGHAQELMETRDLRLYG